ncbi:hypothetical protein QAD02_004573 [Eretmocerus hayati]|uniref:Uncharacterized protein n=1 Tax=Eretmocerus hayati TaxID=131215 RepID=A0ACC2NQA5_9HYME|nr:hypothetical protein QAD02_004573 [Eretmocerus hayati]
MNRRLMATFAQLAITLDVKTVEVSSMQVLNGLSMFMSAHHQVRNVTFRILRDLAYSPLTRLAPILRAILRNMRWTELTHTQFIDEHIVQGNMDILALPELAVPISGGADPKELISKLNSSMERLAGVFAESNKLLEAELNRTVSIQRAITTDVSNSLMALGLDKTAEIQSQTDQLAALGMPN